MPKNLNEEYTVVNTIYEAQKKYRKTELGKQAIRRANERQTLKKMYQLSNIIKCKKCDEYKFERLLIHDGMILCYSCRFERQAIFQEIEIAN